MSTFRSRSIGIITSVMLATTMLTSPALANIGVASVVKGEPTTKPPGETERVLEIGNRMVADELVMTKANDRVHVVFQDGSSLTIGPNSAVTIDKFVYDADKKNGVIELKATKGVFRYVGGAISKTSDVVVKTPSATMGIRGGIAVFAINPNGDTTGGFLFGKMLSATAQGVTKTTNTPGTQITVRNGSPPDDPTSMPPGTLQNFDSQFNIGNSVLELGLENLAEHNSKMSPSDAKNAIEETRAAQDQVHSDLQTEMASIHQGAGPLEGTGPLQGAGPMQGTEPQQGSSPLQMANPAENSGPLEASSPLQAAGPLQNAGPLAASSPLQQTGPIMGGDLNVAGTQPGMNMPYVPVQQTAFISTVGGLGNYVNSLQQVSSFLSSPQASDPTALSNMVNSVTYTPSFTPTTTTTNLPPTIYNPTTSSNVSPN